MLSAGKLDTKINIYHPVEVKGASGVMVEKLEFVRKTWAAISKTANAVSAQNDQLLTTGRYQLRVRYNNKKTLNQGDWLEVGSRWLKIIDIDDTDHKRSHLLLIAEHDHKPPPPINA